MASTSPAARRCDGSFRCVMAEAVFSVRLADLEEFRLFVWELRMLADEMRVSADPYAERLEHALDRFTDEPEGNG